MRKILCVTIALITLLFCLISCNFYVNSSGALAGESQVISRTEEIMSALSKNQLSEAKEFMHPTVAENSNSALAQISDYLDGRKATSIEQIDISVKSSNGTKGKIIQEQLTYTIMLDDGENIQLAASHLSDNDGVGFTSFQIMLGVN